MHHPLNIKITVETANYKACPMFDEDMKEIPSTPEFEAMQKEMEQTKSHFTVLLQVDEQKNRAVSRLFDNANLRDQADALKSVLDFSADLIAKKILGD